MKNKDFNDLINILFLNMVDSLGKIELYKKKFILKEQIVSLIENVQYLICEAVQIEEKLKNKGKRNYDK